MKPTESPKLGKQPYNEALFAPVVTHKVKDEFGNLSNLSVINARLGYHSDYWSQAGDGDHTLFMSHGGVDCRDMPKAEKKNLRQYFATNCRLKSFSGKAILSIHDGMIRGITALEK